MTFKPKRDTATTLVVEVLRHRDDFMTRKQLVAALEGRATRGQVNTALHWLVRSKAIGVLIEEDGTSWWYALPPESDRRSRHHDERVIETKRRPKRRKADVS